MASFASTAFSTESFDPGSYDYEILVISKKKGKSEYPFVRRHFVKEGWDLDQLRREDEEIIAVIVAGVQIGLIK